MVLLLVTCFALKTSAQWKEVTEKFGPLPENIQVYYSDDPFNGRAFQAYYVTIRPSRKTRFTTAIGNGQRFTPQAYYEREGQPLLVVNTTFFSFETNQNLNVVMQDGRIKAYNVHALQKKETDSFYYPVVGAFGLTRHRKPDIAWIFTDSAVRHAYAFQQNPGLTTGSHARPVLSDIRTSVKPRKWKMQTAVGGGPVLVQNGLKQVSNREEMKFANGLLDLHPRTAIGYQADGTVIIMVVAGRMPGIAEGINLDELADVFVQLKCVEALNLDGGGSSCMLINGKETITPSSNGEQRPVPAVLMVK